MDAQTLGLLSAAASGLEAAGPSRTPVSMGQIMSRGLLGGINAYQGAQDREMRQGLLGLQALQLQTALSQAAQKQQAIQAYGQSLPEDQRSIFMANPEAYIGAKTKAMEPFSLKPGEQRYANGQPIATAPESFTLSPGQVRMTGGQQVATVPEKPETAQDANGVLRYRTGPNVGQIVPGFEAQKTPEGFTRNPDGTLKIDPGFLAGKKEIASAGSPKVEVKVDAKTGESLSKPIGEMVQGSRDRALGAIDQLETIGRMRNAINSGNVIAGPGSTVRLMADQIAQVTGIGGQDSQQRLQNTRGLIKGLAEFTINARKALAGQGSVSDYEGRLIEKASSGNLDDMTIPEIQVIMDVADRQARKLYAGHSRNMDTLRNNPAYNQLAPFYEVPAIPDAPQQTTSSNKPQSKNFMIDGKGYIGKLNPQTGRYETVINGRRYAIEGD